MTLNRRGSFVHLAQMYRSSSESHNRARTLSFCFQPPSPDHLHVRNPQNYAPDSPFITDAYKKRTESRRHQLWRERAIERAKRPFGRRRRSTGPTGYARIYWDFGGLADAREPVSLAVNGGGLESQIQRSPNFRRFHCLPIACPKSPVSPKQNAGKAATDRAREQGPASSTERGPISRFAFCRAFQPSITWSAANSTSGGSVRPSRRAVPRFTASSNLVGSWIGSSAGFSPLIMRST